MTEVGWKRLTEGSQTWDKKAKIGDRTVVLSVNWRTPDRDGGGSYWWCEIVSSGKQLHVNYPFRTRVEALQDVEDALERLQKAH